MSNFVQEYKYIVDYLTSYKDTEDVDKHKVLPIIMQNWDDVPKRVIDSLSAFCRSNPELLTLSVVQHAHDKYNKGDLEVFPILMYTGVGEKIWDEASDNKRMWLGYTWVRRMCRMALVECKQHTYLKATQLRQMSVGALFDMLEEVLRTEDNELLAAWFDVVIKSCTTLSDETAPGSGVLLTILVDLLNKRLHGANILNEDMLHMLRNKLRPSDQMSFNPVGLEEIVH